MTMMMLLAPIIREANYIFPRPASFTDHFFFSRSESILGYYNHKYMESVSEYGKFLKQRLRSFSIDINR